MGVELARVKGDEVPTPSFQLGRVSCQTLMQMNFSSFALFAPTTKQALASYEALLSLRGRLENLLTVTTTAIAHQGAPEQNAMESFCSELAANLHRR